MCINNSSYNNDTYSNEIYYNSDKNNKFDSVKIIIRNVNKNNKS